jgi:hypothetical protein
MQPGVMANVHPQTEEEQAAAWDVAQGNKPASHGGNWFTHLLPTIGSLALPALGALLAPETGGLSLIASAGLTGAGAAGGKAAENAAEGKGVGDNVLGEGVMAGAGGLVGGLAGKAFGKASEALGSRARGITQAAEETAAGKAAQEGEMAAAQATRNNFGGIKPGVQASNNLEGNQALLKEWGLDHTNPEIMQQSSKGGLFINDIDQAALAGGKPIKTTDLIASKDITNLTPEEEFALQHERVGIITPEGTISDTVTPQQAHAFGQQLNTQMRDFTATGR